MFFSKTISKSIADKTKTVPWRQVNEFDNSLVSSKRPETEYDFDMCCFVHKILILKLNYKGTKAVTW